MSHQYRSNGRSRGRCRCRTNTERIYQYYSQRKQLEQFIQASTDSLNWDWCIREQNEVGELFHGHTSTIDWQCNYCGKSNEALSSTLKMDIRDRQALLSYAIKEIEEKILPNLQILLWLSRRMSWYCCVQGVESGEKICWEIFLPLFHSKKKSSLVSRKTNSMKMQEVCIESYWETLTIPPSISRVNTLGITTHVVIFSRSRSGR